MNKYHARKTEIDGIIFDSAKEAARYQELKLLERAGEICNLELQPKYKFVINGELLRSLRKKNGNLGSPVTYAADFRYVKITNKLGGGPNWHTGYTSIVEDVKGYDTPLSRLKRSLVKAVHGVEVRIV